MASSLPCWQIQPGKMRQKVAEAAVFSGILDLFIYDAATTTGQPLWGLFIISRLIPDMTYLDRKFEDYSYSRFQDTKKDSKCEN